MPFSTCLLFFTYLDFQRYLNASCFSLGPSGDVSLNHFGSSEYSRGLGSKAKRPSSLSSGATAKKPRTCSICHQPGHTRKTCPQNHWAQMDISWEPERSRVVSCYRSNYGWKELESRNKSVKCFLEGLVAGCSCQGIPSSCTRYIPGQQGLNQLWKVTSLLVSAFVFSCSSAEQIRIV